MATHTGTIKTRIQLKSDTEANWIKSALISEGGTKLTGTSFVPLLGELIVFLPDSTHPFSRLKIGDNEHSVMELPFIDAGTLNGTSLALSQDVFMYNNRQLFPQAGLTNKLYVDLATNSIYCYNNDTYYQLSNIKYQSTQVKGVLSWTSGYHTEVSHSNGILNLNNGKDYSLLTQTFNVLLSN